MFIEPGFFCSGCSRGRDNIPRNFVGISQGIGSKFSGIFGPLQKCAPSPLNFFLNPKISRTGLRNKFNML